MARPQKKGLDYFPLDVNFYGDIKIRKLMRNNGGGKAAFVYVILLSKIYESGYYMLWDDDMSFMLSDITGFEEGMIRETIKSCLKFGLLDAELFSQHHILTSKSIQSRYFEAVKRRVRNRRDLPYVYADLLTETGLSNTETSGNSEFLSTETEFLHTETPISATESTQKKSKVKDKSSLRSDFPFSSSTTSTSRVRDGDGENLDVGEPVDVKTVVEQLKTDRDWLLQMQRRHGIEAKKIIGWLNSFVVECNCRGTQVHKDKSDVMRHFNDWLKIQVKSKRGGPDKGVAELPYRQLWIRAKAELCASVTAEQSAVSFDLMMYNSFVPDEDRLVVTIPSQEVYDRLESEPYISTLTAILRKYYGAEVRLGYKFKE